MLQKNWVDQRALWGGKLFSKSQSAAGRIFRFGRWIALKLWTFHCILRFLLLCLWKKYRRWDKEQHFCLTPHGLSETSAESLKWWFFYDPLMNQGSFCQWEPQSNGFHAWVRLSSCALVPPWEELHSSLKGRRRRSPKLLAYPSVIQHYCPVTIASSPVIHHGWQDWTEWHPHPLCCST